MDFYTSAELTAKQAFLNRGTFFGESPFTTLLSNRGKFLFLEEHLARLSYGYKFLYERDDWKLRREEILGGLEQVKSEEGLSSYRITFFQLIENHEIHFFIYRKDVQDTFKGSHKLKVAKSRRVEGLVPTYFKYGNYCETNFELREAFKKGFDDIIFLDDKGFVKECSTSNIFFRKKGLVCTPRLEQGLLGGITRANLIKCLETQGTPVEEGDFTLQRFLDADEVWLTSSIKGVRIVSQIEEKIFDSSDSWSQEIAESFKSYCGLK